MLYIKRHQIGLFMMNRIKALREDHDYTQQYVADCIGITQRKYSYLETGTQQLTAEILVLLANLYNVSVDISCFRQTQQNAIPNRITLPLRI